MGCAEEKGGKERMRVYISSAVMGNESYAYKQFNDAINYIFDNHPDAEFINPYAVLQASRLGADLSRDERMKICFCLMDLCDAIYIVPGSEDSLLVQQEKVYAQNRSMEFLK